MSAKKSNGNGFDGLVAIQLCTKSWPGIVNLIKEDLGVDKVPEFFHLGNKKLYPAEWRQAFNRKISDFANLKMTPLGGLREPKSDPPDTDF